MPSSSKKQHNFMAAIAHSPEFAKKVGVPQRVGREFVNADKGNKMNPRARKAGGRVRRFNGEDGSEVIDETASEVPKFSKKDYSKKDDHEGEQYNYVTQEWEKKRTNPVSAFFTGDYGDYKSQKAASKADEAVAKAQAQGKGYKEVYIPEGEAEARGLSHKTDKAPVEAPTAEAPTAEAPAKKTSTRAAFNQWFKEQYAGGKNAGKTATFTDPNTGKKTKVLLAKAGDKPTENPKTVTVQKTTVSTAKPFGKTDVLPTDEITDLVKKAFNPKLKYAKGGWIKSAIKKPGALRKSLGVKAGEKIPAKKLESAAGKPGKLGQRARLAQTLKGFCGGGSTVKRYAKGGTVSSVSSRADGIASKGRTRCKIR